MLYLVVMAGSGGGGQNAAGGDGNTPPVSPPQGNPGGGPGNASGGGGAGAAGANGPSGAGGAGLAAFSGDTGVPTDYGTPGPGPGRYFAGVVVLAAQRELAVLEAEQILLEILVLMQLQTLEVEEEEAPKATHPLETQEVLAS